MNRKVDIFDSTLRDGVQGEGISFTADDKLRIIQALDQLGVCFIELGNPAASPKEAEFYAALAGLKLTHSRLVSFGSTCRKETPAAEDQALRQLAQAFPEHVTIYGKAWRLHVTAILGTTLEENLRMIHDSVHYLTSQGKRVFYDAEHFFDGYRDDPDYALRTLEAAVTGGARCLVLCDTNGGTFSYDIRQITSRVKDRFSTIDIGIHCHNDCGLAVANSLAAIDAGARQVQGTFLGFGERCGNANLSTLIPLLQLKSGHTVLPENCLNLLTPTARLVAEIANIPLPGTLPFVGASAFAHKAGTHADGVVKDAASFEQVGPHLIGNERRFLMSDIAGRSSIMARVHKICPGLDRASSEVTTLLHRIKHLEHEGYQFEAADGTFELIIRKHLGYYEPYFELISYKIMSEHPATTGTCATATIKIRVGASVEISAAEGEGPVHALDKALRRALERFYPSLSSSHLTDYKVRVMDPGSGAAAKVRVLITSTDGSSIWSSLGVSTDIIEASWLALTDAMDYKLTKDHPRTTPETRRQGATQWAKL
jgi:2-isopropylmalate synthase